MAVLSGVKPRQPPTRVDEAAQGRARASELPDGLGRDRGGAGMSSTEWKVPRAAQPKPEDYGFDLDRTLSSVVGLSAIVPSDAFTAETLGTERAGNGVLIGENGLVLTIGYLITEAE